MAHRAGLKMSAYPKFSERWWSTPKNQDHGCPPPKAPKSPKAVPEEDATLGALGALGGAPLDSRKWEETARRPGTSAALAGAPSGGSGLLHRKVLEHNRNTSSSDQVTDW